MDVDMDGASHTCSVCRIGTLRRRQGTYAAWRGDQFVVVPSTPVWMCDVCGERLYDQDALDQLSLLIGQNTPSPDTNSATHAQRGSDASADETTRTRRRA